MTVYNLLAMHCVESVRIRSFSGPYFPAFGRNIQSQCGKIQTKKIPNMDAFHAVMLMIPLLKLADEILKKVFCRLETDTAKTTEMFFL